MGTRKWGVQSGSLPNGGNWTTPFNDASKSVVISAGSALRVAVSSSIAAAVTGSSGAGSMDAVTKTALSASYATAVAKGV